ncbi:hypothetical protein AcW1_002946 [Taiwanofungus camphoratus]|nr:hypothetical protein AcW1_002946 [Antrodia cinnamomea]
MAFHKVEVGHVRPRVQGGAGVRSAAQMADVWPRSRSCWSRTRSRRTTGRRGRRSCGGPAGAGVEIVGDDLLSTNVGLVARAVDAGACNAPLLKVNQIGTVSGAMDACACAVSLLCPRAACSCSDSCRP